MCRSRLLTAPGRTSYLGGCGRSDPCSRLRGHSARPNRLPRRRACHWPRQVGTIADSAAGRPVILVGHTGAGPLLAAGRRRRGSLSPTGRGGQVLAKSEHRVALEAVTWPVSAAAAWPNSTELIWTGCGTPSPDHARRRHPRRPCGGPLCRCQRQGPPRLTRSPLSALPPPRP